MARAITREKAERKKEQAVGFLRRIGEPDRAQDFEEMSVDDYAAHRGFELSNPRRKRRNFMANGNGTTKQDLQSQIDDLQSQQDEIGDILSDAYQPESTREDMAAAIGEALDILNGEDSDDSDDSDDGDDDDLD